MIIYISGKIGEEVISEATRKKFMKARNTLLKMGHKVYDPTDDNFQVGMKMHVNIEEEKWKGVEDGLTFDRYAWILLYDLHFIALCDAVLMLEDWKDSPGARSEHEFAKSTGKKILYTNISEASDLLLYDWLEKEANDKMTREETMKSVNLYIEKHLYEYYIPVK